MQSPCSTVLSTPQQHSRSLLLPHAIPTRLTFQLLFALLLLAHGAAPVSSIRTWTTAATIRLVLASHAAPAPWWPAPSASSHLQTARRPADPTDDLPDPLGTTTSRIPSIYESLLAFARAQRLRTGSTTSLRLRDPLNAQLLTALANSQALRKAEAGQPSSTSTSLSTAPTDHPNPQTPSSSISKYIDVDDSLPQPSDPRAPAHSAFPLELETSSLLDMGSSREDSELTEQQPGPDPEGELEAGRQARSVRDHVLRVLHHLALTSRPEVDEDTVF